MAKVKKCIFYSYKGGAGRTTTLVNVAYQLRKKGKSVLIVDFDFASPGIHLFDQLRPRIPVEVNLQIDGGRINKELKDEISRYLRNKYKDKYKDYCLHDDNVCISEMSRMGQKIFKIEDTKNDERFYAIENGNEKNFIIEYEHKGILEYLSGMQGDQSMEVNLEDYICEIEGDKFDGALYTMGVCRWDELGTLKAEVENNRQGILYKKYLENLYEEIISKYSLDYILIDSRPGREYIMVFEILGMILGKNDMFVLCTNYNIDIIKQSHIVVEEMQKLMDNLKIEGVRYYHLLTNRPHIHLLDTDRKTHIKYVEEYILKWELLHESSYNSETNGYVKIDYEPNMATSYKILDRSCPTSNAYDDYEGLAEKLILFNETDILNKINFAKKETIDETIKAFSDLKKDYDSYYQVYLEFGMELYKAGRYEKASEILEIAYKRAEEIGKGGHPDIALWLGKAYYNSYNSIENNRYLFSWNNVPGNDTSALINFFERKFNIDWVKGAEIEKSGNRNIKISTSENELSLILCDGMTEVNMIIDDRIVDNFIAKKVNNELCVYDNYIWDSIFWFEKADTLDCQSKYELYHNWSKALIEYASTLNEKEDVIHKLEKAAEIIENAINANPTWEPYETKGIILAEKGTLIEQNKIQVLKEADKALLNSKLRGGSFSTSYLKAKNLYEIATLSNAKEKADLLKEAESLFESTAEYQENDEDVYYWWGITLALLAGGKSGDQKMNLMVKASEKLNTAVNLDQAYKKAHFYLGALLFIIEKEVDEKQKPLYFRDAFYNMEWTVSLNEPDLLEFYFEADQIQEFKADTYQFVRTLEDYYGYPPLFQEWVGKKHEINEKFLNILKKAIENAVEVV